MYKNIVVRHLSEAVEEYAEAKKEHSWGGGADLTSRIKRENRFTKAKAALKKQLTELDEHMGRST